jgi:hypothetical protein
MKIACSLIIGINGRILELEFSIPKLCRANVRAAGTCFKKSLLMAS